MLADTLSETLQHLENAAKAAHRPTPALLAVSKLQPASAVAELARAGQRAFGENYVQEAQAKIGELAGMDLEWHLIGHLQSNKAELAAHLFDWVQTVDRHKLIGALSRYRPADRAPLNVLVQVNIDDEASKHGCRPDEVAGLAEAIAAGFDLLVPLAREQGVAALSIHNSYNCGVLGVHTRVIATAGQPDPLTVARYHATLDGAPLPAVVKPARSRILSSGGLRAASATSGGTIVFPVVSVGATEIVSMI